MKYTLKISSALYSDWMSFVEDEIFTKNTREELNSDFALLDGENFTIGVSGLPAEISFEFSDLDEEILKNDDFIELKKIADNLHEQGLEFSDIEEDVDMWEVLENKKSLLVHLFKNHSDKLTIKPDHILADGDMEDNIEFCICFWDEDRGENGIDYDSMAEILEENELGHEVKNFKKSAKKFVKEFSKRANSPGLKEKIVEFFSKPKGGVEQFAPEGGVTFSYREKKEGGKPGKEKAFFIVD